MAMKIKENSVKLGLHVPASDAQLSGPFQYAIFDPLVQQGAVRALRHLKHHTAL